MSFLQKTGLFLLLTALALAIFSLFLSQYRLTDQVLHGAIEKPFHRQAIRSAARQTGLLDERIVHMSAFIGKLRKCLQIARENLEKEAKIENWKPTAIPEGVNEWDFRLGKGTADLYLFQLTRGSARGLVVNFPGLFAWLLFGSCLLGGVLFILPKFRNKPGIHNDHIFHHPATRGLTKWWRTGLILLTIAGIFLAGLWVDTRLAFLSLLTTLLIAGLVWWAGRRSGKGPARSASPSSPAWLGIAIGLLFIGFYILLYWYPEYLVNWIIMADPLSRALSGNPASQWFLYGLLYTLVMLVMGLRMIARYRHNRYQLVRTGSVLFFQTAFAFLIPEILVRLNQPYFDFKNIWPLDYDFFFEWNLTNLIQSGGLGIFMLVWGIVLIVIGVPVLTYFFGKRWYCSWVCGCGGLAETMGDPFRQLSDKSLQAWRAERWIVHGVLVFAVVMTVLVLYTFFTGNSKVWGFDSYSVRSWYGFLIGSAFAGVVGTGFYPMMGNRVWCRFGCPLAAYLGLWQRFRSRFRITTNGGQCISCGNCSAYCEMGIDVRWYAQRGQDIIRASCVGCGICSAVCPRGVLRLENGPAIHQRAQTLRTLHISREGVRMVD